MTCTRRRTLFAIGGFALSLAGATVLPAGAQAPSFPCGKATPGGIVAPVCRDSGTLYGGRNESGRARQGEVQVAGSYSGPDTRSVLSSSAKAGSDATSAAALVALPVVATQTVAPGDYAGVSDVARRGGAPIDVALAAAGAFEGSTQHAIQENRGAEAPAATRVTLLRDGFLDDAVRGDRWQITMERTANGGWRIVEVTRAWRCRRGAQQDRFGIARCP